jgi:hypothetical protein
MVGDFVAPTDTVGIRIAKMIEPTKAVKRIGFMLSSHMKPAYDTGKGMVNLSARLDALPLHEHLFNIAKS